MQRRTSLLDGRIAGTIWERIEAGAASQMCLPGGTAEGARSHVDAVVAAGDRPIAVIVVRARAVRAIVVVIVVRIISLPLDGQLWMPLRMPLDEAETISRMTKISKGQNPKNSTATPCRR